MRFTTLAVALAGVLSATAAPTKRDHINDVDIFQYALTLEHLENVFYKQAISTISEEQFTAAFGAEFYGHLLFIAYDEEQHVIYLEDALKSLGVTPVKSCTYDFGDISTPEKFVSMAATVEGVGVSAYLGAAPVIMEKSYLTAAGAILVTEALHQSTTRDADGRVPFANVFGTPLGFNAVFSIASAFIKECPADNPTLPVYAYPTLTLDSGVPTSTEGATIKLVPESQPSGTFFATFVSGLKIIPVEAQLMDGAVMVQVPMNISGQSYVFLTKDNSGNITDDTVGCGPAILEVTPPSPTFDFNIQ